jgi:ADP-heptose:LPS heptosyltransferase
VILVLRALGVGDLATAVPALRGLRAAFPGETLSLAAPTWLTPLIELIGGIDRIVAARELEPLDNAPAMPRLAVNLHGSGPESHRRLRALRPGTLWAFASRAAGHDDGPGWHDDEHEVRRWCRLVRYYGVDCDPRDLDLAVPRQLAVGRQEVTQGVTIIHPGAKSPARRWPAARFAAVARRLRSAGHRVLITGSAAEHDLCVRVAEDAGLGSAAVPRTDLGELAALVARARLVISGDTGIGHLATAYRTPSVTLFGPVSPQRWGPPADRPYHRAIWHGTRSERGDLPGPVHPALLAVTEDEVLAAADQVCHAAAAQ